MCTNPKVITVKDWESPIHSRRTSHKEVTVKCGKCDTCRMEKAQEWAIKLINEGKYHKKACFITLTFDNKLIKTGGHSKANDYGAHSGFVFDIKASKEYFQKFMKRLRKHFSNKRITFFHVGEYGEKYHRPHHHVILYGINFTEDGKRHEFRNSTSNHPQYFSETLTDLWAAGICTIQDLNPKNTMYISQYTLKKFKGEEEKKFKPIMSFSNRSRMSQKWLRRNFKEVSKGYLEDADGKKYRVPKSYIRELKRPDNYNKKMYDALEKYEDFLFEHFNKFSNKELIKKQKNREEAMRQRAKNYNKKRDF